MANSAGARSTCAAGALSERLRRVSSWRSSAVSGRRGAFRWRDMAHLGARGSPHHYTSSHGRRPTSGSEPCHRPGHDPAHLRARRCGQPDLSRDNPLTNAPEHRPLSFGAALVGFMLTTGLMLTVMMLLSA